MNDYNNKINAFFAVHNIDWESIRDEDTEGETYNFSKNKLAWLKTGRLMLCAIARTYGWTANVSKNPSGSINRGYVTAFFGNNGKYMYVQLADGMKDILFRTAASMTDYTGNSNNTARLDKEGLARVIQFCYDYLLK